MTLEQTTRMTLTADVAQELMTPNPISIRGSASIHDALVMFVDNGISAMPVTDASGRLIGVLSQTDIIVHDREAVNYASAVPEYYVRSQLTTRDGEKLDGFEVENVDRDRVRDLMTPIVFSVNSRTPCPKVVEHMLKLHVHRLFVVDDNNVLVGVISALDVLNRLKN